MKNSFDLVAGFYDRLADLMFGRIWEQIQIAPAARLKPDDKILIVGGGTGRILPCLPAGQNVTFVELSNKMLRKAEQRESAADVTFIHADYLDWNSGELFDAIVFPFFLDSFSEKDLIKLLQKTKKDLKINGELHVIDFQRGNLFQNTLVWLMYRFFRVFTGLGSYKLLNINQFILASNFSTKSEDFFKSEWVFYRVYTPKSAI